MTKIQNLMTPVSGEEEENGTAILEYTLIIKSKDL